MCVILCIDSVCICFLCIALAVADSAIVSRGNCIASNNVASILQFFSEIAAAKVRVQYDQHFLKKHDNCSQKCWLFLRTCFCNSFPQPFKHVTLEADFSPETLSLASINCMPV